MFFKFGFRFLQRGFGLVYGTNHFIKRLTQTTEFVIGFYANPVIELTGLFDVVGPIVEQL